MPEESILSNTESIRLEKLTDRLTDGLEAANAIIQNILVETKQNTLLLEQLNEKHAFLREAVEKLQAIVREGNGDLPLVSRVNQLENSTAERKMEMEEEKKERKRHRAIIYGTLATSLIAFVTSWLIPLVGKFLLAAAKAGVSG